MPPTSQATDALWHCLCPSFARVPLRTPASNRSARLYQPWARRRATSTFPRELNGNTLGGDGLTSLGHESEAHVTPDHGRNRAPMAERKSAHMPYKLYPQNAVPNYVSDETTSKAMQMGLDTDRELILYRKFVHAGKSALYSLLDTRANIGDILITRMIVKMLVKERGEEMEARHYCSLILANASATSGSAASVGQLLEEMRKDGIPLDSDTLHAALKALSIHPDYLLRSQVLEQLQQYWFPLSRDGWQWMITGMIRDKQIELALEKFKEMQELNFEMEPWFLNFLLTTLLSVSAFPEALIVLQMRCDSVEPISSALWDHALTIAAQSFVYPIVEFIWRRAVASKHINPSSGTCADVLAVASRYGDFRLATDVFRILGQRSSALFPHHYESLYEAYLNADDLDTALSVLSVMASTTTPPSETGVSSLYQYLLQDPKYPTRALQILHEQSEANKPVALATINAIFNALGQFNALEEALHAYNKLHLLIPSGPNTATFNALLRGCSAAAAKDKAMFLAAEMRAKKVPPDTLTYDRLILVCSKTGRKADVQDAYRYWEEMCMRGWWPRQGTVVALIKAMVKFHEQAAWTILQENSKRGLDSMVLRRWVNENWPKVDHAVTERKHSEQASDLIDGTKYEALKV